ncbi:MAG TPA: NAD(P)-dependent oxidoreductase [Candidatus Moranbacteria bacterium]|nr:NAD(P)-dependent oxidoreductase [Candidatus Moranbacteria bacterium]
MKKKKIVFITGASGFIGKNTARYFNENGWYVVGLGLGKWTEKEFKSWGIDEWHPGLITKELLSSVKKKLNLIIHCAGGGSVGFSVKHPKEDFNMTVKSTRSVLEFMRSNCPNARLIYPSSAAVYGQKKDLPIKESDILAPVSPYGLHKKMAEELCKDYSRKYSANISIVRFFSVYGPGLQKQLLWDASCKIYSDENKIKFFGTGLEKRDWIYISDVVELFFILAKSKNKFEIVNGGSGLGITIKDVLAKLLAEFQKNKEIVFNNISKEGDPEFYTADIEKVKKTGWRPRISLEDGIKKYVIKFKEYQENG